MIGNPEGLDRVRSFDITHLLDNQAQDGDSE